MTSQRATSIPNEASDAGQPTASSEAKEEEEEAAATAAAVAAASADIGPAAVAAAAVATPEDQSGVDGKPALFLSFLWWWQLLTPKQKW